MSVEGWEEVVLDVEVAGLLRRGVRDVFEGVPVEDSELDLELVDIAVERWVFPLGVLELLLHMSLRFYRLYICHTAREIWSSSFHTPVLRMICPWRWT
jgi:hypothetical protein